MGLLFVRADQGFAVSALFSVIAELRMVASLNDEFFPAPVRFSFFVGLPVQTMILSSGRMITMRYTGDVN